MPGPGDESIDGREAVGVGEAVSEGGDDVVGVMDSIDQLRAFGSVSASVRLRAGWPEAGGLADRFLCNVRSC